MEFQFIDQLQRRGAVLLTDRKVLVPLGRRGLSGIAVITLEDWAAAVEAGASSFNRGPDGTVIPQLKETNANEN